MVHFLQFLLAHLTTEGGTSPRTLIVTFRQLKFYILYEDTFRTAQKEQCDFICKDIR
jgi:hypothetical protein